LERRGGDGEEGRGRRGGRGGDGEEGRERRGWRGGEGEEGRKRLERERRRLREVEAEEKMEWKRGKGESSSFDLCSKCM